MAEGRSSDASAASPTATLASLDAAFFAVLAIVLFGADVLWRRRAIATVVHIMCWLIIHHAGDVAPRRHAAKNDSLRHEDFLLSVIRHITLKGSLMGNIMMAQAIG